MVPPVAGSGCGLNAYLHEIFHALTLTSNGSPNLWMRRALQVRAFRHGETYSVIG
jgi:hypothetical protein